MPDGRMLSKSIAHSVQLGAVSIEADYLFARCIPHLDCEGRMTGHPALVKATACPLRPEITIDGIPDLLRSLSGAGLVQWYEADGKLVLQFPGFKNHQRGAKLDREAASRYPAPPSGFTPDPLRTKSGPMSEEVRVSEVEVEVEVEVEDTDSDADASGGDAAEVSGEEEFMGVEVVMQGAAQGGQVIPLRQREVPAITSATIEEVPDRLTTGQVLVAWSARQDPPPDEAEKRKQGAAAKRIATAHSGRDIVLAFLGMKTLYPYSDGAPWDLFDLEKKFSKAKAGAKDHPELRRLKRDAEFHDILASGGGGFW